ncbi:UNVERIFIED_CONTAM: hypothetical protein FKN15_021722 [Acipenser sinensis]
MERYLECLGDPGALKGIYLAITDLEITKKQQEEEAAAELIEALQDRLQFRGSRGPSASTLSPPRNQELAVRDIPTGSSAAGRGQQSSNNRLLVMAVTRRGGRGGLPVLDEWASRDPTDGQSGAGREPRLL